MAKDLFEQERSMFQRISDEAGELSVEVGEWTAEQTFGDPGLDGSRTVAIDIYSLLRVAARLSLEAIKALPNPGPDPSSSS